MKLWSSKVSGIEVVYGGEVRNGRVTDFRNGITHSVLVGDNVIIADHRLGLYGIFDGVDGYGVYPSELALTGSTAVIEYACQYLPPIDSAERHSLSDPDIIEFLQAAIRHAAHKIRQRRNDGGTTAMLVTASRSDDGLVVVHYANAGNGSALIYPDPKYDLSYSDWPNWLVDGASGALWSDQDYTGEPELGWTSLPKPRKRFVIAGSDGVTGSPEGSSGIDERDLEYAYFGRRVLEALIQTEMGKKILSKASPAGFNPDAISWDDWSKVVTVLADCVRLLYEDGVLFKPSPPDAMAMAEDLLKPPIIRNPDAPKGPHDDKSIIVIGN